MKSLAIPLLALASGAAFFGPAAATQGNRIEVAAQSERMIWNAVAIDDARGGIYVAGPRWTGSKGPQLGRLDAGGEPQPWPDAAWNAWRSGQDPGHAFVNINAIHRYGDALWVVDTGSPDFGGTPLPGGAKLVKIDLGTGQVLRTYAFPAGVLGVHSYVDDLRIRGTRAYLTDAGEPGLIVLDTESGQARRVLDHDPSTPAPDRPIVVAGETVRTADGQPLKVNADPLELSPDGRWLYFGPLGGPMSRIETRWLDDAGLDAKTLAAKVRPWFAMPPVGGTAMDRDGSFYFTDLAQSALRRRRPDGRVETVVADARLHWVDAPAIDQHGTIWMPVPQMDRAALFHHGQAQTRWPVQLLKLKLRADAP